MTTALTTVSQGQAHGHWYENPNTNYLSIICYVIYLKVHLFALYLIFLIVYKLYTQSLLTAEDTLPDDIIDADWRNTMEELLDFDEDIDDKALIRKLQHQSYSARSLQLQQIVEFLPQSIADEIISYELSSKSIEIFIRRSISNNVVNKVDVMASLSGWTLTLIGAYLFFCGLNLFELIDFNFIPSEKLIYVIGNYTPSGWRIELSVVLALCAIHFIKVIGVYQTGRKWSKKLKRIKNVLDFGDHIETTAYIPGTH